MAGAEERATRSSSDGDGRIYRLAVPVPKLTYNLVISRRSCAVKAKKCTKKRDAGAELLFSSSNLLFLTFPLPSSSWFRKVPNSLSTTASFFISDEKVKNGQEI